MYHKWNTFCTILSVVYITNAFSPKLFIIIHSFCASQAQNKNSWQIANTFAVVLVDYRYNIKHETVNQKSLRVLDN